MDLKHVRALKILAINTFTRFFSASVTAVFRMDDGSEKKFTRSVHGSTAEHKINGEVFGASKLFLSI